MIKPEVLEERMNNLKEQNTKEHKEIKLSLDEICVKLEKGYVTRDEFEPYKWAFRLVGSAVILTTIASLLKLVFIS